MSVEGGPTEPATAPTPPPRRPLPGWIGPAAVATCVIALVAWSAWQRWRLLSATPFPTGIDGYFYPVELRSLLETGRLQYPAAPLVLWWMLPFAAATDPIVGAKLGAAIGGALIAVPAYFVGARLGGAASGGGATDGGDRSRGAGLIAAAVATMSVGSLYLTAEFAKNGCALTVALAAVALALRACDRPTRGRAIAALVAFAAAILAHKVAAGLAVALAAPAVIARVPRRHVRAAAIAGTALAALAIAIGILAPQRFLSVDDLALLRGLVSTHAEWSAPALAMPGNPAMTGNHEALAALLVAIVAGIAMVLVRRLEAADEISPGGVDDRPAPDRVEPDHIDGRRDPNPPDRTPADPAPDRGRAPVRATAWAAIGLALAIGLPWLAVDDPEGLGFRLRLVAFVPLGLVAAIAARLLVVRLARAKADLLLGAIATALVVRTPARLAVDGEVVPHPAMVAAVAAQHIPPQTTAIVPERQVAFMVAWYTRAPVSIRPTLTTPSVRLIALHWMGDLGSPLDQALDLARATPAIDPPLGTHPGYRNGFVQITERTWAWLLAQLPPADRAYFAAWPTL